MFLPLLHSTALNSAFRRFRVISSAFILHCFHLLQLDQLEQITRTKTQPVRYHHSEMGDDIRKVIQQIIQKVTGLYTIIISDRDGVPVLTIESDKAPEVAMRPSFLSTFGLAIDQGGKLGLGKTRTLICTYSHYQVIQMNKLPLIVSFIASDTCNTGHILALEQQIEPILKSLKLAVVET